jgi:DDE superfamily endonuclease
VVAALEAGRSCWTALGDAVRLGPTDDATAVTACQLRGVVGRLIAARHWRPGDPDILIVCDAGYDVTRLAFVLADLPVQLLGRLRCDRVLRLPAPPGRHSAGGGRPPKHGPEFALDNPATWPGPQTTTTTQTTRYGTAAASSWDRLHPRLTHRTCWLDHHGELPIIEGTLIRLQVDHPPGDRDPKPVWLWSSATGITAAHLDRLWQAFLRRFDLEIVCTQVTKPGLGAGRGGRDHVADLHLAVGDHHPVDQQLHQLAALLEPGLVQAHPQLLQHGRHRVGDRAHLDQPLTLGGDLPLAGQQVRLLSGKGPVLALEADQVDHLGQVSLQKPLALACHARPDAAQGRLPAAQLPRHPGAAVGALQRLGDQLRLAEDGAQVRPDQLVELAGGDEPRRAAA